MPVGAQGRIGLRVLLSGEIQAGPVPRLQRPHPAGLQAGLTRAADERALKTELPRAAGPGEPRRSLRVPGCPHSSTCGWLQTAAGPPARSTLTLR